MRVGQGGTLRAVRRDAWSARSAQQLAAAGPRTRSAERLPGGEEERGRRDRPLPARCPGSDRARPPRSLPAALHRPRSGGERPRQPRSSPRNPARADRTGRRAAGAPLHHEPGALRRVLRAALPGSHGQPGRVGAAARAPGSARRLPRRAGRVALRARQRSLLLCGPEGRLDRLLGRGRLRAAACAGWPADAARLGRTHTRRGVDGLGAHGRFRDRPQLSARAAGRPRPRGFGTGSSRGPPSARRSRCRASTRPRPAAPSSRFACWEPPSPAIPSITTWRLP